MTTIVQVYLLFAWDDYEAGGGPYDCLGVYSSTCDAKDYAEDLALTGAGGYRKHFDNYEIRAIEGGELRLVWLVDDEYRHSIEGGFVWITAEKLADRRAKEKAMWDAELAAKEAERKAKWLDAAEKNALNMNTPYDSERLRYASTGDLVLTDAQLAAMGFG